MITSNAEAIERLKHRRPPIVAVFPLMNNIFRRREAVCRCGWSKLHRSRTFFYEWPLMVALMALRCERCTSRFWRMRLRRMPFVWFDFALDVFSVLRRSPVFVGILLILLAATTGAILGYWAHEIGKPAVSF
jgi:hypothetical protein